LSLALIKRNKINNNIKLILKKLQKVLNLQNKKENLFNIKDILLLLFLINMSDIY